MLNPQPRYRFEDWLVDERERREGRSEYVAGEIFARVDASEPHHLIVSNIPRQPMGNPYDRYLRDGFLQMDGATGGTVPARALE